eukprot:scaffold17717_cov36-Phaeocystis_antarctica.AAC.1
MLQWKPDSMVKVPLWQCPRSAPTPRLLRARLTVLAGSALPGERPAHWALSPASSARATRLQSCRFPALDHLGPTRWPPTRRAPRTRAAPPTCSRASSTSTAPRHSSSTSSTPCREQGCSAFGQLALWRLRPAPDCA